MLSHIGVFAQTEPEVILLENDEAIINYFDENNYLLHSQYIENYSQSAKLDFLGNETQDGFGDEDLIDLVSFPTPELGLQPKEYCFNPLNHKYYIYGGNKIAIYNSLTNEHISTLDIAESADIKMFYTYPKLKSVIYIESSNKVLCVTSDNSLAVIDGATNQLDQTFNLGTYYDKIFRSIYFDNFNNKVFVTMFVQPTGNPVYTKLLEFSTDGIYLGEYIYNFGITDIEPISTNKLFISSNVGLYKVYPNDLNSYEQIVSGYHSNIVFASNENKIYTVNKTTNSIISVNVINDQVETILENYPRYVIEGVYNPINKKVYLTCTEGGNTKSLTIISTETNDILYNSIFQNALGIIWVEMDGINNRVYYLSFDRLCYKLGNNDYSFSYIDQYNGLGNSIGFNPDLNQVISLKTTTGFFQVQDAALNNIIEINQDGGWCETSTYNSINDKIYITDNRLADDVATVSIYDGSDLTLIDSIEIGNTIRNIYYSEVNNKTYVLNGGGYIKVINGDNNNIDETLFIGGINSTNILTSNGNYLYTASFGEIDKLSRFNLQNHSRTDLIIPTGTPTKLVWGSSGSGYLNSGTGYTGTYLNYISLNNSVGWSIERDNNEFLIFSPTDTTVFTQIDNEIVKLDGITGEQLVSLPINNFNIVDATYLPEDNSMIVLLNDNDIHHFLWKINCNDLSINLNPKQIPSGLYNNMYLNKLNNRLYIYLTIAGSDRKAKLLSYNPVSFEFLGTTNLGPQQSLTERNIFIEYPSKLNISLNTNTNQLIIPNWIYSNFSVVQCPEEERTFKNGWNWVSFPKLERENDDAVALGPLLNTMEPMPSEMLVQHMLNTEGNPMTWAEYIEQSGWTFENLDELQSTKGYKIEITDETDEFKLTTPGTRLVPNYPIMLAGDMKENWIGYYEYQQADPFDALAFCLDNLRVIKGQYWSAYYEVIDIDKGSPVYGWIMSRPQPLNYGDMLIVQGIDDCELIWNQIPKPGGKEKAETSYFEFEEQADYTSVFIELDENTDVNEIGAFVGESCVGATVVEEGDEMVEIQAYLQGVEGDEMYFETHSTSKSAPAEHPDYYVKDFNSMQYVNRKIRPYDQKPYHMVSFKNEVIENQDDLIVYHFPNPAKDEVTIHFNLPADEQVSLELMDVNGKLIERIDLGSYPMGTNEYSYKIPQALSKGVYLYKFITSNTTVVNQLVIQ